MFSTRFIISRPQLLIATFLLFLISPFSLFSQESEVSKIKWMSLTEAMEKVKKEPKPVIIDFYTDWCGWCKQMMKTTYSDENLANYINLYFYPVKFNAEGKDTIEYLGTKYGPMSLQPKATHELAAKLLSGKLMYPTTLFLNGFDKEKNSFSMNMIAPGYLDLVKIQPVLIFTLENVFRNSSIEEFTNQFNIANADTSINNKLISMKWKSPSSAFVDTLLLKKHKTLVFLNADWCNSCKVMKRTSFTDSLNISYLSKTFNCVDFNVESTDTINFRNQKFINPRTEQQGLHQFAYLLTRNNFSIPAMVLLDENLNYLDAVPSYLPPQLLSDISHFYGDDIYKKKSWSDYYKETEAKQNLK